MTTTARGPVAHAAPSTRRRAALVLLLALLSSLALVLLAGPASAAPKPPVNPVAPVVAARSSSGVLAGSVFDLAGWGTFVHSLRERTVRKP